MTRRTVLGSAALALAACARPPARGVTWWAMSTEGENAPLLLPRFTRASGIPVDVQAVPWTAAHEKVLTGYAGGSLPDVLMVANSWTAELAMLGALAPVPPGLDAGLLPAAHAAATVGGHLRAVPWTLDAQAVFYRRDLLAAAGYDAPPAGWDAWRAMARALKRRRPDDYAVLLLLDWPEVLLALGAQGPEPLLRDRASRGNFSSPGFRAALAFYKSLFDERLAPPIVGTQAGDSLSGLARGWFALLPASAYTAGDLARRTDLPRTAWATAPMPGAAGARALIDGASLVVTAHARDPAAAWALVGYLTSPATQLDLHAITGDLPTRAAAWAAPQLAADPAAAAFASQFVRGVPPPAVPEWARIVLEVQAVAERMVRGEFGVDAAARVMDTTVDRILAKRRWLLDRGRAA